MRRFVPWFPAVCLALLAPALPSACGRAPPSVECTGPCTCTGNTCECQAGQTCTLGPAGAGDGSVPAAGAPSNITFDCNKNNTCNITCGTSCVSHCANDTTCAGTCGSSCDTSCTARSNCTVATGDDSTLKCEGTSGCTLTTGERSTVTCGGGSTCTVTLSPSSTLACLGTSTCNVSCPRGGCTVDCSGDAKCTCDVAGCTLNCQGATDAGLGRTAKECGGKLTCVRGGQCP